ncbi:MAG TPA: 50S ribosomal protein L21 [Chitinivibrionales bacterium]
MFSIVEQGGFQYKVSEGDTIKVPMIQAEKDAEITLEKVLMVGNGDQVKIGSPVLDGAVVKATVVDHGKYRKVVIMKKKRRKGYKRKTGHRQTYTKIKITSISA